MQDFIITQKNNIWWGMFPRLTQAGFGNACSCRLHGESDMVPGTLNLALHVGDEVELVLQNRRLFAQALGLDASKFTTCEQVHGSNVAVVDEALVGAGATALADTIKDTDALVTNLANVPLLLFFADCVPLLFADERQGVCAVAHAGWRGTVAQIGRKTVKTMQQAFGSRPEDIIAAIGPSIGQCCYEVDDFVRGKAAGYEQKSPASICWICGGITVRCCLTPALEQKISLLPASARSITMKCSAPTVQSREKQDAWVCACTECLPRKMRKY